MTSNHMVDRCREHYNIVAQCRCPSPNKTVRYVPCPGPAYCKDTRTADEKIEAALQIAETYADPYNGSREHGEFSEIARLLRERNG